MLTKLYVRARNFMAADEGATAVEYGIMVAGIAVAIIAIVFLLGAEIGEMFQDVLTKIGLRPAV